MGHYAVSTSYPIHAFLPALNTIFPLLFAGPKKRLSMEGNGAVTEEREVEIHGSLVRQRHLDKLNLDSLPTETCEIITVALCCRVLGQYIMSQ